MVTEVDRGGVVSRVLATFQRHKAVDIGSGAIQWDLLCKVLYRVQPDLFTQDAMDVLFKRVMPTGSVAAPTTQVPLESFISYMCGGELPTVPATGQGAQNELSVRLLSGTIVLSRPRADVAGSTVQTLLEEVRQQLRTGSAAVDLLLDGRALSAQELLSDLFVGRAALDLVAKERVLDQKSLESIPNLAQLLATSSDDAVLEEVCRGLGCLGHKGDHRVEELIQAGVLSRLVEVASHQQVQVSEAALVVLGKMLAGNASQSQRTFDSGLLPVLGQLLSSQSSSVRKLSYWALSNAAANGSNEIQQIIDQGLLQAMVEKLKSGAEQESHVTTAMHWVVQNAFAAGTDAQVKTLVSWGILRPVLERLTVTSDEGTLGVVARVLQTGQRLGAENPFVTEVRGAPGFQHLQALLGQPAQVRDTVQFEYIKRTLGS